MKDISVDRQMQEIRISKTTMIWIIKRILSGSWISASRSRSPWSWRLRVEYAFEEGVHHTPGINLYLTRCVYSLYPFNSSRRVRSSQVVRRIKSRHDRMPGIKAHNEPRERGKPTKMRQAETYPGCRMMA